MATTMVGQSCKLLKILSGIRNIQISHIQQIGITRLKCPVWSGAYFHTSSRECAQSSHNVPQKPKVPPNVFIMYLQRYEQELKKVNPDLDRKEIVRQASRKWQELDPEEKSRLQLERKDLFEKYQMEKRAYLENITPEQIQAEELKKEKRAAKRLKHARKSLGKPKKPLSSFGSFVSEKFAERAGEAVPIFFKHLINEWGKMSDAEKEIYKQKAQAVREKYDQEMTKWEQEMMALGRFDVVRKSVLAKIAKADKDEKKKSKVGFSVQEDKDKEV